jgi:hypothetical protein
MSTIIRIMKECFLTFEFKLQEYLPRDKNHDNFKIFFIISISWFLVVYS